MATQIKKPKISYCVGCNREYSIEHFYERNNKTFVDEFSNGYFCYCTDCCENILKTYIKRVGTLKGAFYYTCARLNIPFVKRPYDSMIKMKDTYQSRSKGTPKGDAEYNLFQWYYDFLWGKSCMMRPTDMWNEFKDSDMKAKDEEKAVKAKEAIELEMEKYKLAWGNQESIEDYKFLSYVYEKYTQDITIDSAGQEDLYRDLCLARLDKRKIDEGRSTEDVAKVQTRILNLMTKLKIDEFNSNKPKTLSEQFLSSKISMINENNVEDIYNSPCEMKDFNKIQQYYKDICLRPLGNMLCGQKNFDLNIQDIEKYNMDY